ncbi:hypothetical protein M408DRAFT_327140 [Serendipita vermifera MAFF 305830]|uniref:Secreted protein n=1 Tax=Serendipita vermifera MAFF 305830 TaxID=933852 RepID=A0A0C2XRY8_SERVB|nr:hypothetical protein M408DRAFT_327140 [Serendipita vermifera MAFF 305830]
MLSWFVGTLEFINLLWIARVRIAQGAITIPHRRISAISYAGRPFNLNKLPQNIIVGSAGSAKPDAPMWQLNIYPLVTTRTTTQSSRLFCYNFLTTYHTALPPRQVDPHKN